MKLWVVICVDSNVGGVDVDVCNNSWWRQRVMLLACHTSRMMMISLRVQQGWYDGVLWSVQWNVNSWASIVTHQGQTEPQPSCDTCIRSVHMFSTQRSSNRLMGSSSSNAWAKVEMDQSMSLVLRMGLGLIYARRCSADEWKWVGQRNRGCISLRVLLKMIVLPHGADERWWRGDCCRIGS